MISNSYLSIPSPERLRHRTTSLPEVHERYVSVGGFVNIQELTKNFEATKANKSKQQYGLFGSVSPRSRNSRASSISEDVESQDWDSVPTTPYRNEGWLTPQTPKTPFAGLNKTNRLHKQCQTPESITPPPVLRYNQYGHDLYLETSPRSARPPEKNSLSVPPRTSTSVQSDQCTPVELAGSLLLPSQGFPQSNPPERPPHVHERSHSAPATSQPQRSLPMIPENFSNITVRDISITGRPPPSLMPAFDNLEMTKQFSQREASRSTPSLEPNTRSTLPVRKSSLRSKMPPPQYRPPPVPLSRMSLEELMEILPNLDAAIIAQDWMPCVRRRHQEQKDAFEKLERTPVSKPSLDFLNQVRCNINTSCGSS